MPDENPVAIPSDYWTIKQPTWDMVDTLTHGTWAMRASGKAYLPQEPREPEEAYKNRLARSVLTPLYEDTINKLVGKIMKQPVIVEEDVPAPIARYEDDVDAGGTDLNEWTRRIAFWALNHGVTYILVDSPNIQKVEQRKGAEVDRSDVNKGTLRPYAVHIKAPQIIGWKTEVVDGQIVLTQARILIVGEEDSTEDEFTQVTVKRIHVWEIGKLRIYREVTTENGQKDWVLEEESAVDLPIIPLIPVYGEHVDFMKGEPPMLEIAHINVTHWQSDSDQRHILHVARVPILFGSGLGDTERGDFEIEVGPNTMTRGPMGSEMKYIEIEGGGIEAGRNDLEVLENRIAKLGLNMILKRPSGDVTATARALDQSEADSPLGMFARHLEKQLEAMFDLFGQVLKLGEDSGGSITVYKDFSITMRDGEDIKALADMRAAGDLSQPTYWAELLRRNLLSDDFDAEKEIDLLDLEYQDGNIGLTGDEADAANKVGDETGNADGHTHVLQANGWTNEVDGHRHKWDPAGTETSEGPDHEHPLKGEINATDRATAGAEETQEGQQAEETPV